MPSPFDATPPIGTDRDDGRILTRHGWSEPRPMTEVIPGRLWQSGQPTPLGDVADAGVNAVVSVCEEVQPWIDRWKAGQWDEFEGEDQPRLRVDMRIPLIDCDRQLDEAAADAAIGAVVRLLEDPWRRVLVHCDGGAFRSVHVTAGVYAAVAGCSGTVAFRHVDKCRGMAWPRSFLELEGWHEHAATFGPGGPLAPRTVREISGALRSCMDAHGPITPRWIGSAAKRVHGALYRGDCS